MEKGQLAVVNINEDESTKQPSYPSTLQSALAVLLYGFLSVSMIFCNKLVMNTFEFPYSNVMILMQMIFSVLVLDLLKSMGYVTYPGVQLRYIKKVLPIAVAYCMNVAVALAALRDLNVPMYNCLKRLATPTVMVAEWLILKKVPSTKVRIAVSLIVAGAILAGAGDLDFDVSVYVLALSSCVIQAIYLVWANKANLEADLNSFGLLYYSSVLSVPFLLAFVLVTGELTDSLQYPYWTSLSFQAALWTALIQGAALNFALFYCTLTTSALTTTIVGQLKVIFSTTLGFFVFGGSRITAFSIAGVILNSTGGYYYAMVKLAEKSQKKAFLSQDGPGGEKTIRNGG